MTFEVHWPCESLEKGPTSVETIICVNVFMGGSDEGPGGTRGDADTVDEGEGGGLPGDGDRGIGIGHEDVLEPDGDNRATEEECEMSLDRESSVVWLKFGTGGDSGLAS